MHRIGNLALAVALTTALGACGPADELGSAESYASDATSIFFSKHDPQIRKILATPTLGDRSRYQTGILNVDGKHLSEDTVLIFDGALYRFDAAPGEPPEPQLIVLSPELIEGDEAANDAYMRVDFKDASRMHVLSEAAPLGVEAGVFRGRIIATDELALGDDPGYVDGYVAGPNTMWNAVVYVLPNASLTKLVPATATHGCYGDAAVDVTLDNTPLSVQVGLDGFPTGRPLTVEMRYLTPWSSGTNHAEHIWDWLWGLASSDALEETLVTKTIANYAGDHVEMPVYTTETAGYGADHFEMVVEVRAYTDATEGPFAEPYLHGLTVVDDGARIGVDHFELCPLDDTICHEFRDEHAPDNVIARRNVIELKAEQQGLYQTKISPVGSCSGGNVTAAYYSDYCNVYTESQDIAVASNVAAAANFELSINGKLQAGGSLQGSYQGIASGEIEAELKGGFDLDVDFGANFATSKVWEQHSSLQTIYDPSTTQIQWWRVVQPRLRYLEVAEFNACGNRIASAEVYLRDLRDSRLVLACEEVPSYDTLCHAVEPTAVSVAACETLLIDPESDAGKACVSSCGDDCH